MATPTITNVSFSEHNVTAFYKETNNGMVKGLIIPRSKVDGAENQFKVIMGLLEEFLKINTK